jgi:hypothetical protein
LRKKFVTTGVYKSHPEKDVKIWKFAIKRQILDLGSSLTKCDAILKVLSKLQKDVARTQDDLEKELQYIKTTLEKSSKAKEAKMKDLEAKLKATGCVNNAAELMRAIFSFGIACAFDNDTQVKLKNMREDLKEEKVIMVALLKRMGYFDGLVGVAKELTKQATGLMETTKSFRSKLANTKEELEQDYRPEDIEDNLGDVDFANDFAETLWASLSNL